MNSATDVSRESFADHVVADAPRLGPDDEFRFACHPGVSCFGDCCGDVNIFLTPLDVLRLKNRLGLSSSEFIERHTILPDRGQGAMPAPVLRMKEEEGQKCPFLTEEGCSVYEARPWACRMYPLGFARPPEGEDDQPFYFLVKEDQCRGFEEDRKLTVRDWVEDQGIGEYDEAGEWFQRLTTGGELEKWQEEDPRKVQMFFMATYDLDTFRRFVFESSFLERFSVPAEEVERLRTDDEALMRFGFRWLDFTLFGKRTMEIRPEAMEKNQ